MLLTTSNFTVYEVEEIKDLLVELVKTEPLAEIDFENISKMDFAGVSLLVSLAKTCKQKQIQLKFINLKPTIIVNIELCGCDKHLRSYYE